MERDRLTRLVQDAASVERSDLADLETLTKRFPWFAGAQILRSTGVSKTGEVLAAEALREAAAHVPSRSILFEVVHRNAIAPKTVESKTDRPFSGDSATGSPTIARPKAMDEGAVLNRTADTGSTEAEPWLEGQTSTPAEPGTVIADARHMKAADEPAAAPEEARSALESLDDLVERSEQPAELTAEDPLERQILESALASAFDLTWTHDAPTRTKRPGPIEPAEDPITFPPQGPLIPQAPLEHKPAITRHGRYSFMTWLEADNYPSASGMKPKAQEEAIPVAVSDWVRSEDAGPEEVVEPQHPTPKPPQKPLPEDPMATSDLIDRFINQQVPAAPARTEFFTPQQAAKRSLDDKAGLVTETLARVYAKQGNIPKAIEAYKRLALKYPEKSAYFAALQKELEGQLNK